MRIPDKALQPGPDALDWQLGGDYQRPDDRTGHRVARLLLSPSDTLDRLTQGICMNNRPEDPAGRIGFAFDLVMKTSDLDKRIREARKNGELQASDTDLYEEARQKNIIDDNELALLQQKEEAVLNAIRVDEFSFSGWDVESP